MKLLSILTAIVSIVAFLPSNTHAQFVGNGAHSRLADGANAEANGGGDSSLIGINTAGINNWGVNQWDLSAIEGVTVTEVTLTFSINAGFANANHGTDMDTVSVHQLYDTNAGWIEGGQSVNMSNVETMGGVTFNFQSQTSETEGTPWQDASGADVANFLGAFDPTPIDTAPAYNQGEAPESGVIEFTVPIATAQAWVDDPASFAGLVLVANDLDGDSRSRFNFVGNPAVLSINPVPAGGLIGDVNQDGTIDFFDIQPFIDALSSAEFLAPADINGDGMVDFFDIQPFIDLLSAGAI